MSNKAAIISSILVVLLGAGAILGRYLYTTPKFTQGSKAEMNAITTQGKTFTLSDYKGKYVLLDFWGSWCGPCVREMPAIVRMYDKFQNASFTDGAGFEVVSIAAEEDSTRWAAAVQTLNMKWPTHILGMQMFDSPQLVDYGVRYIPTKLLVNPEGVVISHNQSVVELDDILEKRLKR